MNTELQALQNYFDDVIDSMPEEFDSHEFILRLAHQHQPEYIAALASCADRAHPFMTIHGQIAQRLSQSERVMKIGERNSSDIFRQSNSASVWQKR